MGHHPLVSELDGVTRCAAGMRPGDSATVVRAGVDGVRVVTGLGLCLERLGKVFSAHLGCFVQARIADIVASATGAVEHVLGDSRVKQTYRERLRMMWDDKHTKGNVDEIRDHE